MNGITFRIMMTPYMPCPPYSLSLERPVRDVPKRWYQQGIYYRVLSGFTNL